MSKALRHVQHSVILSRENFREVQLKGRRFRPQINDDIIDSARCAPHQFSLLAGRDLVVYSAQRSFRFTKRDTELCQPRIQAVRFELSLKPGPSEKSSFVFEFFRL